MNNLKMKKSKNQKAIKVGILSSILTGIKLRSIPTCTLEEVVKNHKEKIININ